MEPKGSLLCSQETAPALFWARLAHSTTSYPISLRCKFMLSSHLRPTSKVIPFLQYRTHFLALHVCYMSHPSHLNLIIVIIIIEQDSFEARQLSVNIDGRLSFDCTFYMPHHIQTDSYFPVISLVRRGIITGAFVGDRDSWTYRGQVSEIYLHATDNWKRATNLK